MTTIYFVRHGEVHNPTGIIYGQLPGFGLSTMGREQIAHAAVALAAQGPIHALYASPLQRAQESAAILAAQLGLVTEIAEALIETGIGGYQGQPFTALPRPYITETLVHEGIEPAGSIRTRMLAWATAMQTRHPAQHIIAVSHRDPIIVALLHWLGQGLQDLPEFALGTGTVYAVQLLEGQASIRRIAT